MIEIGAYRFGAVAESNGAHFRLVAPAASRVDVVVRAPGADRVTALQARGGGWFAGFD